MIKIDAFINEVSPLKNFRMTAWIRKSYAKEVEKFLSKELTKDFNKVVKKMQEAKSDAVGFGRTVRAFHPKLWEKGDWNDTFSELPINVKVKAEIIRTGILN